MRLNKFNSLNSHPWYKKQLAKLSKKHIVICHEFLAKHENLSNDEFIIEVNRFMLGKKFASKSEQNKMLICQELLNCSIIK